MPTACYIALTEDFGHPTCYGAVLGRCPVNGNTLTLSWLFFFSSQEG